MAQNDPMPQREVSKKYLRLRSGISIVILSLAGVVALLISLSGQQLAVQNAQSSQLFSQLLVSVAEMSLAFDELQDGPDTQRARFALGTLQRNVELAEVASNALYKRYKAGTLAPENMRILGEVSLNPIEEVRDVDALAKLVFKSGLGTAATYRASQLGVQLTQRLLPVVKRLNQIEADAARNVVEQQRNFALIAISISGVGILVVVFFVHLPMERFIVRAQARIEASKRRAEDASNAKSAFLATMSHEIRTPLNGIMGVSEILMSRERDTENLRLIRLIADSGETLLSIINDVLDMSKIEAGKSDFEIVDFNMFALSRNVCHLFAAQAKSKGVDLKLTCDPGMENWQVRGAEKGIKQVLTNLVSNATKFTESGTVSVHLSAENAAPPNEKTIEILIEDTGIGIEPKALNHIFEQFSQADSSTTARFGGTGLGLAIVQKICDEIGGTITVKSSLGSGSAFLVRFPVKVLKEKKTEKAVEVGVASFSGHVLVVDDNQVNRLVAKKFLNNLGLSVDVAKDGVEAVRLFQHSNYDLVLMDVRMPNLDGLDATREIRVFEERKNAARVPIVGLSVNALEEHKLAGLEAGMDGYLSKPLKKHALALELEEKLPDVRIGVAEC